MQLCPISEVTTKCARFSLKSVAFDYICVYKWSSFIILQTDATKYLIPWLHKNDVALGIPWWHDSINWDTKIRIALESLWKGGRERDCGGRAREYTSVLDKVFQLPDFNKSNFILNTNKLSSLRGKDHCFDSAGTCGYLWSCLDSSYLNLHLCCIVTQHDEMINILLHICLIIDREAREIM